MASVIFTPTTKEFQRGVLERKLLGDVVTFRDSPLLGKRVHSSRKLFSQHIGKILTNAYKGLMVGREGINSVRDFLDNPSLLCKITAW